MFYVLRTPKGITKEKSAEMHRYVNITYLQMIEDWNEDQIYFESNHTMRRCEPADFGDDKQSQGFWHTWITDDYRFDLFCPDLEKQDLFVYNQKGAMKSKSIQFQITRCVDEPENQIDYCKD